jgi:hypothetical protein
MRSSVVLAVAAVLLGGCGESDCVTSPSACTASELTAQNVGGDWMQLDAPRGRSIRIHLVPHGTSLTGSGTVTMSDGQSDALTVRGSVALITSERPVPAITVVFTGPDGLGGVLDNMLLIRPDTMYGSVAYADDPRIYWTTSFRRAVRE